jgi:hypothetical protein
MSDVPVSSRQTPACDASAAARQVSHALERIAVALARIDASALLAAEADLGRGLAQLDTVRVVSDRDAALVASRDAKAALLRCRRLGASFSRLARAFQQADPATGAYDRAGGVAGPTERSSVVRATV